MSNRNPSNMYNIQSQFGDTGTTTAHGPADAANGFLGVAAPNIRCADAKKHDKINQIVPLHDSMINHFSAFRGDLLFEHIGSKNFNKTNNPVRVDLVATANGVDPKTFTEEYAYRGVCLAQALYHPTKPAAVAFTMRAKMSQKNTGIDDIHVGDEVEFYAKPLKEAEEWMAKHKTKRVPLGLRCVKPNTRAARAQWVKHVNLHKDFKDHAKRSSIVRYGVDSMVHDRLRQIRGNVIGTALSSASPGANFDILLKPPV